MQPEWNPSGEPRFHQLPQFKHKPLQESNIGRARLRRAIGGPNHATLVNNPSRDPDRPGWHAAMPQIFGLLNGRLPPGRWFK